MHPLRIATGAFILNSGLSKLGGDDDTAKAVHGMAAGAYAGVREGAAEAVLQDTRRGEIALGGALLFPLVPAGLAGLGLTAFSGALLTCGGARPACTREGSPRPTQQGTAIAKDVWMLGIGLAWSSTPRCPNRRCSTSTAAPRRRRR